MAGPVDYAKAGAELNKKALMPMFIAVIIVFAINIVLGIVGGIIIGVFAGILGVGVGTLVGGLVAGAFAMIGMVFRVAYINMAIRLRKGETVSPADVLKVGEFLVPAALLGAPIAAGNVIAGLGGFVGIFATIGSLVGLVATIAILWAPFEFALKKVGYMDAWKESVGFWKTNPVGHLIFVIVGGIMSVVFGFLIFGAGAATCAFLMYYTDKKGIQPFVPASAAPAAAGAPS